jgi:hypothetical protein
MPWLKIGRFTCLPVPRSSEAVLLAQRRLWVEAATHPSVRRAAPGMSSRAQSACPAICVFFFRLVFFFYAFSSTEVAARRSLEKETGAAPEKSLVSMRQRCASAAGLLFPTLPFSCAPRSRSGLMRQRGLKCGLLLGRCLTPHSRRPKLKRRRGRVECLLLLSLSFLVSFLVVATWMTWSGCHMGSRSNRRLASASLPLRAACARGFGNVTAPSTLQHSGR